MKRSSLVIVSILALVAGALAIDQFYATKAGLAFCTVASAVIVFFHFISGPTPPDAAVESASSADHLRKAIAGSIVVQYLVMVGLVAYFESAAEKLPAITQTLITNFTTIVGVVVAFYFGSSAYVEAQKSQRVNLPKDDRTREEPKTQ